ncbi:MAG: hypothetical protein M3347_10990, partial [Armatimonadota bacterium]|nr:hypothetical protein [Armatimonadota bacterium]
MRKPCASAYNRRTPCPAILLGTLPAFVLLTVAATARAGPLPNTLTVLSGGPAGSSIVMQNVTYDPGKDQANAEAAGTGTLVIKLAGMTVPASATVPFQKVLADDAGQVTGGAITLDKDMPMNNLFGSGIDLILGKGAQVGVVVKAVSAEIKGPVSAKLPYRSEKGE